MSAASSTAAWNTVPTADVLHPVACGLQAGFYRRRTGPGAREKPVLCFELRTLHVITFVDCIFDCRFAEGLLEDRVSRLTERAGVRNARAQFLSVT